MDGKTPLVYVVDDDASVRSSLKRLMKSYGLPVKTFCSAAEFLALGGHDASGCMILDVRMQGMTGLDLQKKLMSSGSAMRIIFITAHDDESARRQAMDNGAIGWFMKPFDDDELLKAVSAVAPWKKGAAE